MYYVFAPTYAYALAQTSFEDVYRALDGVESVDLEVRDIALTYADGKRYTLHSYGLYMAPD